MLATTPRVETTRADRVRLLALGLNAWVVAVVAPVAVGAGLVWNASDLTAGLLLPAFVAIALVTPVALVIGTTMLRSHRRGATWLLLGVGPAGIGITHSTLEIAAKTAIAMTLLAAVALLAYIAGASLAVMRPAALREVEHRPIPAHAAVELPTRQRRMQLGVLSAVAVPLLFLIVWAPFSIEGTAPWGIEGTSTPDRAAQALTAVVAAALSAACLAIWVAPSFRAPRRRARRSPRWLLAASLATAALFGATYLASKL